MNRRHILIAGGGIGGLSAALGLAQAGFSVLVLERAPEFGEIGAGIQLGPNAFHAFDHLGIGEAARARAVYVDRLVLMDAVSAQEICAIPLDEPFRQRFGNPYAVMHRGELHGVLLRACRDHPLVELRSGSEVIRYEQSGDQVIAFLVSGVQLSGAGLIGADGLWSRIRQKMVADGAPRVSGHTTYRSVIPIAQMPEELRWNAAALWAGPRCHVVHYPLSGWETFNLVVTCHNSAPAPVAGEPVTVEEVLAGFAGAHHSVRQIIRHGENWKKWVLCDRDPVLDWVDGRVALLGDAAHPMMQYFAQGACMALEDSVVLSAECVASPQDLPAALDRYQRRRRLRTARVQLQSREIGNHIYHAEGAHAELRNQIMRARSPQQWYDTLQWIYGSKDASAVQWEAVNV